VTSVTQRRCLASCCAVLGLALLACGGTGSNADRKAAPTTRPVFVDPGSLQTYDCQADQPSAGITRYVIEDWETSAGAGWYTNNDRCENCQDYENEIRDAMPDKGRVLNQDELDAGLAGVRSCAADCLASQVPSFFDKPLPAERIPRGRCGSTYAFHVSSGPFTRWGGQFGHSFSPICVTGDCPSDAYAIPGGPYDGVAFWARVAPPSGATMRVYLGESHTDYRYPESGDAGPPCLNYAFVGAQNLGKDCDQFGTFIQVNQDWQLFMLPFDEMRQEGYGKKAPFFDLQHLSNLTFFYGQGSWEIWVDDIAFYKRSAQ